VGRRDNYLAGRRGRGVGAGLGSLAMPFEPITGQGSATRTWLVRWMVGGGVNRERHQSP